MPDTEVGQILTELYAQGMASNRSQTATHHPAAQSEYRSQFRPEYQTQPSPAANSSTPGTSSTQTGHTPNTYSSTSTFTTTSQPPSSSNYLPNTPSYDGLPSPDRCQLQNDSPAAVAVSSGPGSASGQRQQPKRTRARSTKSCERCRSKKLRCDRDFPCGSCKKGGKNGSECSYRDGWEPWDREDEGPAVKKAKPGGNSGAGQSDRAVASGSNLSVVEKMVKIGEAMGRPGHGSQSPSTVGSTRVLESMSHPIEVVNSYTSCSTLGRLDIKGQRSRYVAPGDKMRILDHFEDPKKFITNGFKDPDMVGIMQELSIYQKALVPQQSRSFLTPFEKENLTTEMFRAIPRDWLYGDIQLPIFLHWETIHRVLHIQTFFKECEKVAAAKASGALNVPSQLGDWVLPQIMITTAIVSRLDDPDLKHLTAGRLSEEQIARNIELARTWLETRQGKTNICIHTLQTRTLLLIAQKANLANTQDLWIDSAALVRRAMSMGLHQDPEAYSEMSNLDKEMRRKLWTTIVELDMQFSLAAGMTATVTSSNWNIKPLLNVNDDQLTEELSNYPVGKPETTLTNAVLQITLSVSLKDRLNITNWLGGNLNVEQDAPALVANANLLEKVLRSQPHQYHGSAVGHNIIIKPIDMLFASIMLDMSIRRPLLALYRTVVFSSQSHRFPEARKGALRCSLAMLSHLDALDPAIADLSVVKSRDYLNLFHILCKNDIVQAALLICHEIRSFDKYPISGSATPTSNDAAACSEEPFPHTKHSLTRVVENTLHSLLTRLGEFGSDLKDILPLSVVLQSVRAECTTEAMREAMQRGAERVLVACRKNLPHVQTQQLGVQKQATMPKVTGDDWNSVVLQNEAATPQKDFDVVPVDDFDFQNFDFGWSDWSMNQSWV